MKMDEDNVRYVSILMLMLMSIMTLIKCNQCMCSGLSDSTAPCHIP
jgi:hypothetical protein